MNTSHGNIIKTLAALAATGLVLVAAGPAGAQPANGSEAPKKGCTVNMQNPDGSPGPSIRYDHGHKISVKNKDTGKTHTFTCNDGKWNETVAMTGPRGTRFADGKFQVLRSGAGLYQGRSAPAGGRYSHSQASYSRSHSAAQG